MSLSAQGKVQADLLSIIKDEGSLSSPISCNVSHYVCGHYLLLLALACEN